MRFSLRALFVVTTLIAAWAAWIALAVKWRWTILGISPVELSVMGGMAALIAFIGGIVYFVTQGDPRQK
jgi:hypothetical protein